MSEATTESRKYVCTLGSTKVTRTPLVPTVISRSTPSHSSHSRVPDSRTCPMCGHSCGESLSSASFQRCTSRPVRLSTWCLRSMRAGVLPENVTS